MLQLAAQCMVSQYISTNQHPAKLFCTQIGSSKHDGTVTTLRCMGSPNIMEIKAGEQPCLPALRNCCQPAMIRLHASQTNAQPLTCLETPRYIRPGSFLDT